MVDEGVDTGDIVFQKTLGIQEPVTVSEAKLRVFEEIVKVTLEVVANAKKGVMPRAHQGPAEDKPFQTPTLMDWIRYRVRI